MEGITPFISSLHKPSALLPIAKHRNEILYLLETFRVLIVVGQTGSGKTTQIPKFLHENGWTNEKMIAITQPRRIAATSVAARVAEEMGVKLGDDVGYSIRFEDATSARTRIKFMTDGMLLREALVDPLLSRYSVIMVDEAHERSVSTDILLGALKKIMKRRLDLKIIVSSATLQADEFATFFAEKQQVSSSQGEDASSNSRTDISAIISLSGRSYSVDIFYLTDPAENYLEKAVETIFRIHTSEGDGAILLFVTGKDDIERALQMIVDRSQHLTERENQILALPLHAGLSAEQQTYVFERTDENVRKVVVATNIAEASVTIDDVSFVIDCGFVKLRAFNPSTGIENLTVVPVSKASAVQRAGRAGRTRPGKCYRLYTENTLKRLPDTTVPEIQRSNLAPVVLQLKALGIDNINRFEFFTSPPAELVTRALEFLYSLGALDDYAKLTRPLGIRMAEIAIDPMMAKVLLSADKFQCQAEILSVAAMTSVQGSVWFTQADGTEAVESSRHKFAAEEGDHLTLLNAYQAFTTKGKQSPRWCHENSLNYKSMTRAVAIRAQLSRYLERFGIKIQEASKPDDPKSGSVAIGENVRKCLTSGYFMHAARMQADGSFRPVNGGIVLHAHPSSLMFNRKADWVIFREILESGDKTYIRDVTKIEKKWLLEYAANYYQLKT